MPPRMVDDLLLHAPGNSLGYHFSSSLLASVGWVEAEPIPTGCAAILNTTFMHPHTPA